MDLFDYSYYESDSFIDSAPPLDFRVQRTPCIKPTHNPPYKYCIIVGYTQSTVLLSQH